VDIFNPHLKIRSHGELDWRSDARQLRTKIQLHLKRLVDIRKIRSKEAGSRSSSTNLAITTSGATTMDLPT